MKQYQWLTAILLLCFVTSLALLMRISRLNDLLSDQLEITKAELAAQQRALETLKAEKQIAIDLENDYIFRLRNINEFTPINIYEFSGKVLTAYSSYYHGCGGYIGKRVLPSRYTPYLKPLQAGDDTQYYVLSNQAPEPTSKEQSILPAALPFV